MVTVGSGGVVKKIGIIAKKNKKEAAQIVAEIAPWLTAKGVVPLIDRETAEKAGLSSEPEPRGDPRRRPTA